MKSLRMRLLSFGGLAMAVVLVASSMASYALVRGTVYAELDEFLAAKIHTFSTLIEQDAGDLEVEFAENDGAPEFRVGGREYFQIWDQAGTVAARSSSLGSADLQRFDTGSVPVFRSGTLPDGAPARFVGLTFAPLAEGPVNDGSHALVTLIIARDTTPIEQSLATLGSILMGVGLAALLVSLLLGAWVVSRGLTPVRSMARRIEELDEHRLAERLVADAAPAELQVIVRTLNDLIERLQAAFQREKALSANLAHELRTPISGLRTTIEVALRGHQKSGPHQQALEDCLVICDQTQRMVESLLTLSRAEAGALECAQERFDLTETLESCWRPFQASAERAELTVEWALERPCPIDSDRGLVLLVARNLFDNVISHAPAGGKARFSLTRGTTTVAVEIASSGSALSQEDAQQASERFWCGDPSRSATGSHCGLGLALCRVVSDLLGGRMSVRSQRGGDFTVRFELPAEISTAHRHDGGASLAQPTSGHST